MTRNPKENWSRIIKIKIGKIVFVIFILLLGLAISHLYKTRYIPSDWMAGIICGILLTAGGVLFFYLKKLLTKKGEEINSNFLNHQEAIIKSNESIEELTKEWGGIFEKVLEASIERVLQNYKPSQTTQSHEADKASASHEEIVRISNLFSSLEGRVNELEMLQHSQVKYLPEDGISQSSFDDPLSTIPMGLSQAPSLSPVQPQSCRQYYLNLLSARDEGQHLIEEIDNSQELIFHDKVPLITKFFSLLDSKEQMESDKILSFIHESLGIKIEFTTPGSQPTGEDYTEIRIDDYIDDKGIQQKARDFSQSHTFMSKTVLFVVKPVVCLGDEKHKAIFIVQ